MPEEDRKALQDVNAWLMDQGDGGHEPTAAGCWDMGGWGSLQWGAPVLVRREAHGVRRVCMNWRSHGSPFLPAVEAPVGGRGGSGAAA